MATADFKQAVAEAYQSARDADPHADARALRDVAEQVADKFSVAWSDVVRWSLEQENDALESDPEKPVGEVYPAITDEVRREAAERYSRLLLTRPLAKARELAAIVAKPLGVGPDAVQEWARKQDTFRRPCSRDDRKDADILPATSAQNPLENGAGSTMMASVMNSSSNPNLASEARPRLNGQPPDSRGYPRGPNRFDETVDRLSGGLSAQEANPDENFNEETPTDEESDDAAEIASAFADAAFDAEDEDGADGAGVQDRVDPNADEFAGPRNRATHQRSRSRSRRSRRVQRGVAAVRGRDPGRPDRRAAVREGGCVSMISAPAKNGATHHKQSKPRLSIAPESRAITFEELGDLLDFGRCLVDNYGSDIPTFDAGMIGSWIVNYGTPLDQAEALLAVVPIARRMVDRIEAAKGGAQ